MANAPTVTRNIRNLQALNAGAGQNQGDLGFGEKPALEDWKRADDR